MQGIKATFFTQEIMENLNSGVFFVDFIFFNRFFLLLVVMPLEKRTNFPCVSYNSAHKYSSKRGG